MTTIDCVVNVVDLFVRNAFNYTFIDAVGLDHMAAAFKIIKLLERNNTRNSAFEQLLRF